MTRLEQELRALEIDWPPTPDVASELGSRLGSVSQQRRRRWPRAAWVALAGLLASAAIATAVPPVRDAVGRLLGIAGGERVERVRRVPAGAAPALGRRVTLVQARRRAGFTIALPGRLSAPDEVRLGGELGGGAVSLVYGDDTVLTEIPGASVVFAVKQVGAGVSVRYADVAGASGFWIAPGPRALVLRGRGGRPLIRRAALPGAGVLLWDRGGVGYRLETRRPLAEALAIARSVSR